MTAALLGVAAVCLGVSHFGVALLALREGRVTAQAHAFDEAARYINEWKSKQAEPYTTPPTLPTLDVLTRHGDVVQRARWLDTDCAQPTTPFTPQNGVATWR